MIVSLFQSNLFYYAFLFLILLFLVSILALLIDIKINKKRHQVWLARMRQSGIMDIDNMTGAEFETFLSALFEDMGYRATVTKASGDYGADLILKEGKESIAVQAKRYSKKVGVNAVREAYTAKTYYNCTDAWVITSNYYTRNAEILAKETNVKLVDRTMLIDFIIENKKKKSII